VQISTPAAGLQPPPLLATLTGTSDAFEPVLGGVAIEEVEVEAGGQAVVVDWKISQTGLSLGTAMSASARVSSTILISLSWVLAAKDGIKTKIASNRAMSGKSGDGGWCTLVTVMDLSWDMDPSMGKCSEICEWQTDCE
jgi:hypothetical protein